MQHHRRPARVDAEGAGREADAKLQHLDAEGAGGGEVAELVDHHQYHQHQEKYAYGEKSEQQGFHWWLPIIPSPSGRGDLSHTL